MRRRRVNEVFLRLATDAGVTFEELLALPARVLQQRIKARFAN